MFLSDTLLQSWVPGFICENDPDGPGTGAYEIEGLLRAEHGCAYCLTNAPYKIGEAYQYPVGYYMSRINAFDMAEHKDDTNYIQIFLNMIHEI